MTLTIDDLISREEILDTLKAYSQGLDQRNWEIFDRAWAPNAEFTAPGEGTVEPISPEQLKHNLITRNDDTRLSGQHLLNNTWFEVDGDRAHTVTEVTWVTLQTTDKPDLLFEVRAGGLYVDDLIRTDKGWRITRRTLITKNKATRGVQYSPEHIENIRTFALHTKHFAREVQA